MTIPAIPAVRCPCRERAYFESYDHKTSDADLLVPPEARYVLVGAREDPAVLSLAGSGDARFFRLPSVLLSTGLATLAFLVDLTPPLEF